MIYIHIYFYINTFIAGIYVSDNFHNRTDLKLPPAIMLLLMLSGGVLFYLFQIFLIILKFVDCYFQIAFLFDFYFTNEWRNISEELLLKVNNGKRVKKSLRNYFWNNAIQMVNKRHDSEKKRNE